MTILPQQKLLKEKISAIKNVAVKRIFLGNGSDEAIDLLYRAFCEPGEDKAIIMSPSYGMYSLCANLNNVKVIDIIEGQTISKKEEIITDPLELQTVDNEIENLALYKNNLIETFLDAIKEVAIDCELFKAHNMMGSKYRCFQFNEISLFSQSSIALDNSL